MKKYTVLVVGGAVVALGVATVVLQRADIGDTKKTTMEETDTPRQETSLISSDVSAFTLFLEEQQPMVLDVRTPEEYAEGHLSGARNIDFFAEDFAARLEELDRNASYAIYCRSGNRSGQALNLMRSLGFVSVVNLSGGMLAWEGSGGVVCTATTC